MTITLPTNAILDKLGPDGRNWIKGTYRDEDGAMCLHGAIRDCQPVPGDAFLIEQVAVRQEWGTEFNDAPGTTWTQVRSVIDKHREVTDQDLEATFGPSWRWVVPVVRDAATMTLDQAKKLVTAWAKDRDGDRAAQAGRVALDGAWEAAGEVNWGAALAATRAARAATVAAAGVEAWVGAHAVAYAVADVTADAAAGRHLVGSYGFTREHWDAVTGPWVSVFGPLKPVADPGSDQ